MSEVNGSPKYLFLTFVKRSHHVTGEPQWQARVQGPAGTTLFVPHRDSARLPRKDGEQWVCTPVETIHQKTGRRGVFRIAVVWLIRQNLARPEEIAALAAHLPQPPKQQPRPAKVMERVAN